MGYANSVYTAVQYPFVSNRFPSREGENLPALPHRSALLPSLRLTANIRYHGIKGRIMAKNTLITCSKEILGGTAVFKGTSRLLKNSRRNCPEKGVTEIK